MARPGLIRNRKFIRLARSLDALAFGEVQVRGLGQSLALGSLELMWSAAYESGDDVVGTPDDVEIAAGWNGPPGVLFAALRDAGKPDQFGFIEEIEERPGMWRIHDLYDHAPEYVQRRMEREAARIAKGKTISGIRSEAAKSRWSKKKDANGSNCPPLASGEDAKVLTPAPAPAPAPAPHCAPPGRRTRVGVGSPAFEAVEHWRRNVWPKLSTAECPDLPADQLQSLAALCGKHGPPAVCAAMDAAAADSFWREKLDLSVFISKFPRFLGRKTGAQVTPGRKRVVGVDDNGQPIFEETAA